MSNQLAKKLANPKADSPRRTVPSWFFIVAVVVTLAITETAQIPVAMAAPPLAFGFPADTHNISDDWAAHRARGSAGGTDYTASYGSNLYAMADGIVTIADSSPSGSGGRYIRVSHGPMGPHGSVHTESLHLSVILVSPGEAVVRGQVIGKTGASAFGSEYGTGGPHVHVHGVTDSGRFDLEPYIADGTAPTGSQTIYQITASAAAGWTSGDTGLRVSADSFSVVNMSGRWPQIMMNTSGILYQAWGDGSGWHVGSTGLRIGSGQISAVNMGGTWPQVMVNISGTLHQAWGDGSGWHLASTGLYIGTGQISAVNMGGTWPQVMVNYGGTLYQAWGDRTGWHWASTGLSIVGGQISAVNMGGTWPQVMVNFGGTLHQAWGDRTGWHWASTGLSIVGGQISAVNMGGTWPQVMVNFRGILHQAWGDGTGWHLGTTGLGVGGGRISAVNMGGTWPQAISIR